MIIESAKGARDKKVLATTLMMPIEQLKIDEGGDAIQTVVTNQKSLKVSSVPQTDKVETSEGKTLPIVGKTQQCSLTNLLGSRWEAQPIG